MKVKACTFKIPTPIIERANNEAETKCTLTDTSKLQSEKQVDPRGESKRFQLNLKLIVVAPCHA